VKKHPGPVKTGIADGKCVKISLSRVTLQSLLYPPGSKALTFISYTTVTIIN
jgi:hypothetical protein